MKLLAELSDEQLEAVTDKMLRQMFGDDQAAIEATRRELMIEAGVVVIDAESTAVEAQST